MLWSSRCPQGSQPRNLRLTAATVQEVPTEGESSKGSRQKIWAGRRHGCASARPLTVQAGRALNKSHEAIHCVAQPPTEESSFLEIYAKEIIRDHVQCTCIAWGIIQLSLRRVGKTFMKKQVETRMENTVSSLFPVLTHMWKDLEEPGH